MAEHLSDKPEVVEGCQCAICKMHRRPSEEKFDHAWQIIMASDELRFARQRLSIHELRHIIRAVAEAFQ